MSAFSVNTSTGALTAVSGSPFAAGTTPFRVTVSPNRSFVYVTNQGSNNVLSFFHQWRGGTDAGSRLSLCCGLHSSRNHSFAKSSLTLCRQSKFKHGVSFYGECDRTAVVGSRFSVRRRDHAGRDRGVAKRGFVDVTNQGSNLSRPLGRRPDHQEP